MRSDLPARGEVWWGAMPQGGRRPLVVLSRDSAILGRRRTMVAGCSTQIRGLASEVLLEPDVNPIPRRCVVRLDAVTDVAIDELTERMGRLSPEQMQQICRALATAVACD